jgi:hypothetical protein
MTTEQLRKEIEVINWEISEKGIYIGYRRNEITGYYLLLNPEETACELCAIGSIDDDLNLILSCDTFWVDFVKEFKLCQWEALTLVIRHEANREVDKEVDQSDIGKAVNNLLK